MYIFKYVQILAYFFTLNIISFFFTFKDIYMTLYGAETWSVTVVLSRTHWIIGALDVHWSKFVTNDEIRSRIGQPFLSDTVRSRRLSGHLYRADPGQDL